MISQYFCPEEFRINKLAAMSSAAKDIASRFSWEICAQKTVDELQKATGGLS